MDLNAKAEIYRQKNKTCFILGASGESGKVLLNEIKKSNIFSKITLIGRRELQFDNNTYENLVMSQVFVKLTYMTLLNYSARSQT